MNRYDQRLWVELAITFSLAVFILGAVYLMRSYRNDDRVECMNAGGVFTNNYCSSPQFDRGSK